MRAIVTDAISTTIGSTVVGGGANKVGAYWSGANWLIGDISIASLSSSNTAITGTFVQSNAFFAVTSGGVTNEIGIQGSGTPFFILKRNIALAWTSGDANGGTQDAGVVSPVAKVVALTDGSGNNTAGWLNFAGEQRVSSQFNKSADTSLATVTGLSVPLLAGRTYSFRAYLHVSPDAVGGHKYAIGTPDTLTATAIIYQINSTNNSTNANIINSRQTALGGSVGVVSGTSDYTEIVGAITVNAAGTLAVQFAQNVASGTSSVLVGSFMIVHDMP